MAMAGRLDEVEADHFVQHYQTLVRIRKDYMLKPQPLANVCGLWIFGGTGTGKTHSVVTQHPNRYGLINQLYQTIEQMVGWVSGRRRGTYR